MNHLLEEALEYQVQKLKAMNTIELKIEVLKNQMKVIVEYLQKIRRLKYETNSINSKIAYQELINESTSEYLELESKLNKLEAHE